MFRQTDQDEELKRLEQELLEAEEAQPATEQYRNYSNNYGRKPEAPDYTDTEPEVEEAPQESRGVVIFALILATAAVVLVAALLVRYGGVF